MKKYFIILIVFFTLVFIFPARAAEEIDSDNDGLSDSVEISLGTDPNNVDTDGDGFLDGVEVKNGFNPLKGNKDRSVKRRVEVNLATQSLDYFLNDIKVGSVFVSTGLPQTPTPKGEFSIIRKRPIVNYYHYPNTKWSAEFKKGFYIHGAYWHNKFGIQVMSGGCV
ncbi:MAG: L,D-transpeptidase family protein, partial [Candidatus Magasanikbacteria bacterium]